MKSKSKNKESAGADLLRVKGFYRLQIGEPIDKEGTIGKADGDTGWRHNLIVNGGYVSFLQFAIIASAASKTATHAALGTGGAPIATDTTLAGELGDSASCRCALTTGTSGSKTVNFTFTLNSNIITASRNISNVGLFNGSTTNAGSMFAGASYASSTLATNQAVNGTYQIVFG